MIIKIEKKERETKTRTKYISKLSSPRKTVPNVESTTRQRLSQLLTAGQDEPVLYLPCDKQSRLCDTKIKNTTKNHA